MQSDAKIIDFMSVCVGTIEDITARAGIPEAFSLTAVRMNGTSQRRLKLLARLGEYFQSGGVFVVLGHAYGADEGRSMDELHGKSNEAARTAKQLEVIRKSGQQSATAKLKISAANLATLGESTNDG